MALIEIVHARIDLGAVVGQDPVEFYHSRQALYMWADVKAAILAAPRHTVSEFEATTLQSHSLLAKSVDSHIIQALSTGYAFADPWELRGRITQLTSLQPKGEVGELSTDKANLFYLASKHVVFVEWLRTSCKWNIDASPFDVGAWGECTRIFSRNSSS